jgi:uncharacterized protein (TIGR03435 family)
MKVFQAAMLFTALWPVCAQDAKLQFEVAVIKPTSDRTVSGLIIHLPGERGYRGANMALFDYLRVAFQVRPEQLSGPDWMSTEYFDLEGKADRSCTADELHTMLQNLLVERFQIRLHRGTKEVSGYRLVVEPGGHKLRDHDPEDKVMLPIQMGFTGAREGKNVGMQYLAFYLSTEMGQTVVDETGLKAHYDFTGQWDPPGLASMPPPPPPGGPGAAPMSEMVVSRGSGITVLDAMRKQLGLRLEKAKVAGTQIVIDRIEKLGEN